MIDPEAIRARAEKLSPQDLAVMLVQVIANADLALRETNADCGYPLLDRLRWYGIPRHQAERIVAVYEELTR